MGNGEWIIIRIDSFCGLYFKKKVIYYGFLIWWMCVLFFLLYLLCFCCIYIIRYSMYDYFVLIVIDFLIYKMLKRSFLFDSLNCFMILLEMI